MLFDLYNVGVEPIVIKCCETTVLLNPKEVSRINLNSSVCTIYINHKVEDKLNAAWYALNEIFTLEQMRTVLVINGQYEITCTCDTPVLKIKSHEFVFEKNTSYQTFVFSTFGCTIKRKKLEVANRTKILKRAKMLYLFGGKKTMLPLTGIALISSVIKILLSSSTPLWFFIMTMGLLIWFILCVVTYISDLEKLKSAMKGINIQNYLLSERKEYRRLADDLIQKNLDVNAGGDMYS